MPKPRPPSEKSIQNAILRYLLSLQECYVCKVHGTSYGRAGTPDLLVCYRGRFLALEVKRPGEKLTEIQTHELLKWDRAGAFARVVYSVEDVELVLKQVDDAVWPSL